MPKYTEDFVRDNLAKPILGFNKTIPNVNMGTGQITTFNQLGFQGYSDKPDGWYFPDNYGDVAIILETKNSDEDISKQKHINELKKNISIANTKYDKVIGILFNGLDVIVFKNDKQISTVSDLQNFEYYLSLFTENQIDKKEIYRLTKRINDILHFNFGIKDLYQRMIFTACALVSERYDCNLTRLKDLGYHVFHTAITQTLSNSLSESKKQNLKLELLIDVYSEIKMNSNVNQKEIQKSINEFIDNVVQISKSINSDYWNGEDVMGIFFNEFNRYKRKSDNGQVFTPDHITSLMYRLIDIHKDDVILDAACGSGAFLIKAMCNMIKEAGGVNTKKAKTIKDSQLYGIENDRHIFSLACANMLVHKDGKTNLAHKDSRTQDACNWIASKPITKVLMNPPFERKYGCLDIVSNVLDNVKRNTMCAFILPDKKLEKETKKAKQILKKHSLKKIIKLPLKTFNEGIETSIFIFETGNPQDNKQIFTCYIEEDGLETVKNQGRQDTRNRWKEIEDYWVKTIEQQSGNQTIQWISPKEHLSYQTPKAEFEISEEDFSKTVFDYLVFENEIDIRELSTTICDKVLYSSTITKDQKNIKISIKEESNEEN